MTRRHETQDDGGSTIRQAAERRRFDACLAEYGCVTVSEATLRYQELLPKFLDALRVVAPGAHRRLTAPEGSPIPEDALEDGSHPWWDSEECDALNEQLHDALNEHAPDGFHFGSHDGDGACFGFWPDEEGA